MTDFTLDSDSESDLRMAGYSESESGALAVRREPLSWTEGLAGLRVAAGGCPGPAVPVVPAACNR